MGASLLSPQEVVTITLAGGEALQHAHDQRILHLDIKPQNFLVRRQQDQTALPNLLLADFGVAKIANTTQNEWHTAWHLFLHGPRTIGESASSGQRSICPSNHDIRIVDWEEHPLRSALPQVIFYQHSQVIARPTKYGEFVTSARARSGDITGAGEKAGRAFPFGARVRAGVRCGAKAGNESTESGKWRVCGRDTDGARAVETTGSPSKSTGSATAATTVSTICTTTRSTNSPVTETAGGLAAPSKKRKGFFVGIIVWWGCWNH